MNRQALALALASIATFSASTFAAESFNDRARVVSVRPIHERIPVTREECWNDRQRGYEERRVVRRDTGAPIGAGTVLGAVVGGVLGHQMGGSDRARDAATVGGAVVGGIVGNQIERDGAPSSRERVVEVERVPVERNVERCRTIQETREATLGYDVVYEYAGREFTTRLDRDPGRNLRVRVDVIPVEGEPRPAPRPRAPAYR